jgi:hypothetical protein
MRPFPSLDESFFEGLECFHTDESNWKAKIFRSLGNLHDPPNVLNRILDIVTTQLGATSILLEPYVSTDWADEYQSWYSRTFRDIPKRATRLHFFRSVDKPLRLSDLLNLPPDYTKQKQSPYVGYCVVRPFEPITVADTVLQSPYQMEQSNSVRCATTFENHILGHQLYVTGMPYIQQDKSVSVCAQADLWMIAKYMHARGEARRFRPSEMEEIATSNFRLGSTRDGLTDFQIYNALRLMDIRSDLIQPKSAEDAIRIIYAYVSSEIPVIVSIPEHVFTVIGYTYGNKVNNILAQNDSMAGYVDHFIVHDDEVGPYQKFKVGTKKAAIRGKVVFTQLTLDSAPIERCIIPVPSARINLRESDVRGVVAKLGDYLELLRPLHADLWAGHELKELVTRMYLRRNDQFKRDIYPPRNDDRWQSPKLKWRDPYTVALYWRMVLPLYVWVVEFSESKSIRDNGAYGRQLVGEMLLDSTAHSEDFRNSILSLHLRGKILFRENPPGSHAAKGPAIDWRKDIFRRGLSEAEYSPLYRHYF